MVSRPRRLRVGDDGGGGAVLDGAAGVGPFGLAEDLDAGQMGRQRLEAHQRRVSDAFEDGCSERFDGGDHVVSVLVRIDSAAASIDGRQRMCDSYNRV